MILKFRESTISRLERLRKREKEGADNQEDVKEREIVSRKVDFPNKWAYAPVITLLENTFINAWQRGRAVGALNL